MEIGDGEFARLADLMRRYAGINLTEKKRTLVRGRLSGHLRSAGIDSFGQYLDLLEDDPTGTRMLELIDRIATNHSYFYREPEHFDDLVTRALPEVLAGPGGEEDEIRIWCAAAAGGEEPYTIAMMCREHADKLGGRRVRVLATDISVSALAIADRGLYTAERVRHLPEPLRQRHLRPSGDGGYLVRQELRDMVTFRRLNLMRDSYPFQRRFHAVFLRNVMIYFATETKIRVVGAVLPHLHSGGTLYTGRAESIDRLVPGLSSLGRSRYTPS